MPESIQPVVRRTRRVSGESAQQQTSEVPASGSYRGFGSVAGETLDQFHDRMFEIDPLEAMMYEMEVALE